MNQIDCSKCDIIEEFKEEIARLKKEVRTTRKESHTDSLTKVFNRKFLDQYSKDDVMGLIIVDIDFFKIVNDTHGHQVGDKVLSIIANTLSKNSRKEDLVIRYGGEEFIVLVRHIKRDVSIVIEIAERYRMEVEKLKIKVGDIVLRKTISCGVSILEENIALAIKEADVALYYAKKSGRNKVVFS